MRGGYGIKRDVGFLELIEASIEVDVAFGAMLRRDFPEISITSTTNIRRDIRRGGASLRVNNAQFG